MVVLLICNQEAGGSSPSTSSILKVSKSWTMHRKRLDISNTPLQRGAMCMDEYYAREFRL